MKLILYYRDGCHLCEQLKESVRGYARKRRLESELNVVPCDVESRPEWIELYAERIPVLTHDGKVILEGNPDERAVTLALDELEWGK